jgi:EAL domain-containing protein (putative c-di-GMP-specific phosphodiesterase class I)
MTDKRTLYLSRTSTLSRLLGISPSQLELEITEGMLIRQPQSAIRLCATLREMESVLRQTISVLGIPRSGICAVSRSTPSKLIDRLSMMSLPRRRVRRLFIRFWCWRTALAWLPLQGVEEAGQAEFLFRAGCEQIQGYLYSRPLPVADFERFATGWQPDLIGAGAERHMQAG